MGDSHITNDVSFYHIWRPNWACPSPNSLKKPACCLTQLGLVLTLPRPNCIKRRCRFCSFCNRPNWACPYKAQPKSSHKTRIFLLHKNTKLGLAQPNIFWKKGGRMFGQDPAKISHKNRLLFTTELGLAQPKFMNKSCPIHPGPDTIFK